MVGPYLGTAPGGAGLAAPGTGLSGAVGCGGGWAAAPDSRKG